MKFESEVQITYEDVRLKPKFSDISSRKEIDTSVWLDKQRGIKLDIPIISSPMDTLTTAPMAIALGKLGGLGVIHRFMTPFEQGEQAFAVYKAGLGNVACAIGANESEKERVKYLVEDCKVNILVLDVAHAHSLKAKQMIQWVSKTYPNIHIMGGSIATKSAVLDMIHWGARSARGGIANGSLCSTARETGCGVPSVSMLLEICPDCPIPVISDGGIRHSGDIVKALGLGASAVMLGSLLAGTDETPGQAFQTNGTKFKQYRGSASYESKAARGETGHVEGVSQLIAYKGPVENVINNLMDGVRSGMSYCGARTIEELWRKAEFIRISQSAIIEGHPHGLSLSVKI